MNRKVHLMGELSKFGSLWEISASSMADIIRLIDCQEETFRPFLMEAAEAGLDIAIVGSNSVIEEPDELTLDNFGSEDIYISLIPAGSRKGWGKILLAAVLIVVGVITFGIGTVGAYEVLGLAIVSAGISLGLQGITQLLAKTPGTDAEEEKNQLFNGPESTLKQGRPVPVLYGQLLVGGLPFHVSLAVSTNRPGISGSTPSPGPGTTNGDNIDFTPASPGDQFNEWFTPDDVVIRAL